jgi:hypothetical protein
MSEQPNQEQIPALVFPEVAGPILLPFGDTAVPLKDVLPLVCWQAGLTPRPCDYSTDGGSQAVLRFILDPLHRWSTAPTSVATLKRAAGNLLAADILSPKKKSDPAQKLAPTHHAAGALQTDLLVEPLLATMDDKWNVRIQAHPSSLRQWVSLRLAERVCFTEVMDAVAASLYASWTWSGEVVLLGPPMRSDRRSADDGDPCTVVVPAHGG